ncbi:hypothetical protein D3I60_15130 [Brevibacterium permense]|uniref:hypothetical protein n=1 Tax=Brevibacterium permense TaxID=234834 RepID=UPI0021CEBDA8|nr:hypothetical protein [Brevibacterium permense]MCU4298388.1 hypothetical protein [Brevibacterium permense]
MCTRSITTIAIAGLLALSGCSGANETDESRPDDSASHNTDSAPNESTSATTGDADEPAEAPDDSSEVGTTAADDSAVSTLTLDTGEKTVTIEPTDVYCSGEPGKLHHIIGKTDNELPLVKTEGTDFVMVKVGQGRPYKTNNPKGIAIGDESVTFDGTELGSATLDGTMTCTDWAD